MSQFDESQHRRDADGKFASKGPSGEASDVELSDSDDNVVPPRAVRTYDEVETDYDGETYDSYEDADAAARKVADAEGYLAVVHMTSSYDPETDVYEGDVQYSDQSFEVKTFRNDNQMSVWMRREGMDIDEGRPDGNTMACVDEYEDPYSGKRERHEGFIHRPERPADGRMCSHYVYPGEVREGDYIGHMGLAQEVLSVDNDHRSTSFELEYEVVGHSNDDPVLKYEPNVMSESEFTHRFDPQVKESGDYYDYEDVKDEPENKVWTVVEGENEEMYAVPGFRTVNRIGYMKSETPWDETTPQEAAWDVIDDEQRWYDVNEPDED